MESLTLASNLDYYSQFLKLVMHHHHVDLFNSCPATPLLMLHNTSYLCFASHNVSSQLLSEPPVRLQLLLVTPTCYRFNLVKVINRTSSAIFYTPFLLLPDSVKLLQKLLTQLPLLITPPLNCRLCLDIPRYPPILPKTPHLSLPTQPLDL
jgi:hypothetical protein